MRIDLHSESRGTNTLLALEIDPARIRGTRSTFGPQLQIGLQIIFEPHRQSHQPILFEGLFRFPGEGYGLLIPLQSVGGGSSELLIPLSDQQVAALERKRAGQEPNFELTLRAIGMPDEPGKLGRYTASHIPQLQVPRDVWKRALDGFGVGAVRIIELPSAPIATESWTHVVQEIHSASQRLTEGRYGEAVTATRTALERMVESIGQIVGSPRDKGTRFAPYVDHLAAELRRKSHGADPLALIGELVKSAFAWTSEPAHQGFHASKRDDAIFALNLCISLYSLLAAADLTFSTNGAQECRRRVKVNPLPPG